MSKRAAVVAVAALLLAACGGGGGSKGGNSATDQIKAAYTSFFSADGSFVAHEAFVEDGTKQTSPIQAAHFIGRTSDAIVTSVSKVTLEGANRAKVIFSTHYSIYNLNDYTGYAVLQNGKWKVASETLCKLVAIWNGVPWPPCNS
jgi:hypothetical protein